jgi:hypothetical protein
LYVFRAASIDEIDSINTTVALEDGIIEDILVGNGSLENLIIE